MLPQTTVLPALSRFRYFPIHFKSLIPEGLPDGLTPADLKRDHLSLPRNLDIAHVFFIRGLIEKVGRGTQRILEDCRNARLVNQNGLVQGWRRG